MSHGASGGGRGRGLWWAALGVLCVARSAAAGDPPTPVMRAAGRPLALVQDVPNTDPATPPAAGPATADGPATAFDPAPLPAGLPATGPASLGQQPLPTEQAIDQTPSQTNTNQVNQLFLFETTPNVCAAGEGYVSGQVLYLNRFPTAGQQFRFQVQGQYGVTDQWAVGGYLPGVVNEFADDGVGDLGLYAQYKFDRFINPEVVDVTGQVDVVLPTGNSGHFAGTGKFGVRPQGLVYKDFGRQGPGTLGLYGMLGFTVTTHSDLRLGVAATYEVGRLAAVAELQQTGDNIQGQRLATFTPGLIYRGIAPLEFAVGVPIGIDQRTPDVGVVFKLTYAFQN